MTRSFRFVLIGNLIATIGLSGLAETRRPIEIAVGGLGECRVGERPVKTLELGAKRVQRGKRTAGSELEQRTVLQSPATAAW
jgi:hypothetical protein